MQNVCSKNLDLFSLKLENGLRCEKDEENSIFITDDNENKLYTFPLLCYEERLLTSNNAESYISISLFSHGKIIEKIRIKSSYVFEEKTYIKHFGNTPFLDFDGTSWTIFFKLIKFMLSNTEQKIVYCYSGWSNDLCYYLFGTLLIDANNAVHIQTYPKKNNTCLSVKDDIEVLTNINSIIENISSNKIVGCILFMYLLLSHIKQQVMQSKCLSPEFVLSIVGKTNSYKTATATAIYNSYGSSISSFEDTPASIYRMLQNNKSGVTIIDDYKISSSRNNEKYEKIVRLNGDVQTNGKYVVGNKVVNEAITGMSVITGEKKPQLQQSSYPRILFVNLEESPINLNTLTQLQDSKADVNSFIVLFVKFVLKKHDFNSTCISLFRNELRNNDNYKGMYGRYYSMYGWFATIWDLYVMLMKKYNIFVEFDFKSEIKSYIYAQHCMYNNDPIILFKKGYIELLNSNEIVVIDNGNISDLNFDVVKHNNKLFIKSNCVYKKIHKFWSEKGLDFPCSERKLRDYLHKAEILEACNGKYTTEKKTRDNRSYSGYYLFENIFMNYGGNTDEEF